MSDKVQEIRDFVAQYSVGASTEEIHDFLRHIRTLLEEVDRLEGKLNAVRGVSRGMTSLHNMIEESGEQVINDLEADNAKLTTALEWYADDKNYRCDMQDPRQSPVEMDGSKRAREALNGGSDD